MPENTRLNGDIGQIDLEFVEREATPQLLMKLSIQLHLAGLSLSNTLSILEMFGVERARSTVHKLHPEGLYQYQLFRYILGTKLDVLLRVNAEEDVNHLRHP